MIEKYVSDLAAQMKIPLTAICTANVNPIAGNPDIHLLKVWSDGHLATTLLWQSDLDGLQSGLICDLLETKIKMALERLQIQIAIGE